MEEEQRNRERVERLALLVLIAVVEPPAPADSLNTLQPLGLHSRVSQLMATRITKKRSIRLCSSLLRELALSSVAFQLSNQRRRLKLQPLKAEVAAALPISKALATQLQEL